MSAIGGIIQQNSNQADACLLSSMSRSLILRGRDGRFAYLNGGVGIFYNRSQIEEPLSEAQPLIRPQERGTCSAVVDGWFDPADDAAQHLLDAYQKKGSACVEELRGSFAAAICDEARGEALLLRDRQGSRPLYYTVDQGRLLFASEIKALLRSATGDVCVSRDLVRAHILAPVGTYAGEALYQGICSLPVAHAGLYSRLGLSLFPLESAADPTENEELLGTPAPFICPDKDTLRRILTEVLFAFDYPQFDHLMPAFLQTLSLQAAIPTTRQLSIEDPLLWSSIPYSVERADRLSRGFSTHARPVIPRNWSLSTKAIRRFAQILSELYGELDAHRTRYLFGDGFSEQIECQRNLGKRIRMMGMLYQTLLWEEHYPIRWV